MNPSESGKAAGGNPSALHTVLDMKGISKSFPGVRALDNVDFHLVKGEVVALLGANGAGKSTLMKIVAGVYQADEGQMLLQGKPAVFRKPIQSYKAGISVVHQETSLISSATVLENIFLGREHLLGPGILDERRMNREYAMVSERFGLSIPARAKVRDLGAAQKKLVEIMKAVSRKSNILIMDEPTDALSRHEAETLFTVVRDLKAQGMSIVFITHFLEEVASVADSATVIRDGKVVADRVSAALPVQDLVAYMLGRKAVPRPVNVKEKTGTVELSVRELSRRREYSGISFDIHRGEVLGVAGVVGSGKTELARTLSGASVYHGGSMSVKGRKVFFRAPSDAVKSGIGMAPEDRKTDGLILEHSIQHNVSMASVGQVSRLGYIFAGKEKKAAARAVEKLGVKYSDLRQKINLLSGGNQQKCVLARWILAAPGILVLDEPTRGIDVGAKDEIYDIVRSLAAEGKSVVYFSGDPAEVLAVSDRVLVMQKGKAKRLYETPPSEDELLKEMIEVNNE